MLSAGWAKFKCAYNKIKKLQSCTIWQSDICKEVEKKIYKEEKAQINQEKQNKTETSAMAKCDNCWYYRLLTIMAFSATTCFNCACAFLLPTHKNTTTKNKCST